MIQGDPDVTPNPRSNEMQADDPLAPWHPAARWLFRIAFCYFALYMFYALSVLEGYIASDLFKRQPVFPMEVALRGVVPWVGRHLLGIQRPIEFTFQADALFGYVQDACLLGVAMLAAVAWSILDRRRTAYRRLHAWLNVALRLTLAAKLHRMDESRFVLQSESIRLFDE